jgi:ribose-phosphate pyrophosphokinase
MGSDHVYSILLGSACSALGDALARALGKSKLDAADIERFPDGEAHVSIRHSVRGQRVCLLQSLGAPVGERLLELSLAADAAHRAGAKELVAIVPYLGYARHDRRKREGEPLGAAVMAQLISASEFHRVLTVDLHAASIEGFFSCDVENLTAESLLADALRPYASDGVIVAPDLGATKLAQRYARRLGLPTAVVHKTRLGAREVVAHRVFGDVRGRRPIVVDDMISTGHTIAAALGAVVGEGAIPDAVVAATHGVFAPGSDDVLAQCPIRALFVTDSTEPVSSIGRIRLERVSLAPILVDVLGRLEEGRSIQDFLAES